MRIFLLVGIVALIGMIQSCSNCKMITEGPVNEWIEYKRYPCMGDCPVYRMQIYNDGSVEYLGRQFVEKRGKFKGQLSKEEYKALCSAVNDSDFYNKENSYDPGIMDLAARYIVLNGADGSKEIKMVGSAPEVPQELINLENELMAIAEHPSLMQIHRKPSDDNPNLISSSEKIDELIIRFHQNDELIIDQWLAEYGDYEVMIKEEISEEKRTFLIGFDMEKITAAELSKRLYKDPFVSSVEKKGAIERR